jgi:chromodomain-helicase-DNA-binding protein 1
MATWESSELLSTIAQQQIDDFLDRSRSTVYVDKTERNPATRRKMQVMREQPDYIKHGSLRDFQLKGVNFLAYNWTLNRNSILADEMGLGKTVQAVSYMSWLHKERRQEGPFIVVVPLSTVPAWADTFDNWNPALNYIVYHGSAESRKIIQEHEMLLHGNLKQPKFNVLLTTWEMVNADHDYLSQIKWELMVVDEAHKLKNKQSLIYTNLLKLKTSSRLLLTGTPVQNNLQELAALLDLIEPGITDIADDVDSLSHEEQAEQLAALRETIQPFMLRRTKEKVEKDLPPKTERLIRMKLSETQLDLYSMLLAKNVKELNEGVKGQKQSMTNILMELRKASNHPFLIPAAEERYHHKNPNDDRLKDIIVTSGKMMLLDQLLTKLKKDNHRVLIFSQMVKMLDLIEEYLQLRHHQFQRLDGTYSADLRRKAMDHFNAPESPDFCFLLTTRAGGLGINLMTADTVIIFDSDWNPQADLQAMARAHRIGQTNPVNVYRLVSEDTIDEDVIQRATKKRFVEYIIMNRGGEDDETSKAQKLAAAPADSRDIIQMLKKRSQNMFDSNDNQTRLEKMDIDAVLADAEIQKTEVQTLEADGGSDFLKSLEFVDVKLDSANWEDIIPKEALEAAQAEKVEADAQQELEKIAGVTSKRRRNAPILDGTDNEPAPKPARRILKRDTSEPAQLDPKRPLSIKECRAIYRSVGKFGALKDRTEDIIKDAGLVDRDVEMLLESMKEVYEEAKHLTLQRDEELLQAGSTNKKDQKTILFDHKNFKQVNAEVILDRPRQMRAVRAALAKLSDKDSFRVPEANNVSGWSCPWGAKEDAMLLIGTDRYGFGSWVAIRDDPELGMLGKMFLDENKGDKKEAKETKTTESKKKPAASHLKARTTYLLNLIYDKTQQARPVPHGRLGSHSLVNGTSRGHRGSPSVKPSPADDNRDIRHKSNGATHSRHGSREPIQAHKRASDGIDSDRDFKKQKSSNTHDNHRHDSPSKFQKGIKGASSPLKLQKTDNNNRPISRDQDPKRKPIKKARLSDNPKALFEARIKRSKEDYSGFRLMGDLLQAVRPALRALEGRLRYANQKNPRSMHDAFLDIGDEIGVASAPVEKMKDSEEYTSLMKARFW